MLFEQMMAVCVTSLQTDLVTCCYNSARHRRRLAKAIQQWETAELLATRNEALIHTMEGTQEAAAPCFVSAWIHVMKLDCMALYYSCGFALELYTVQEYAMVYWYMLNIHEATTKFLQTSKAFNPDLSQTLKQHLRIDAQKPATDSVETRYDGVQDCADLRVGINFGLFLLCVGLSMLGRTRVIQNDLYCDAAHYRIRFKAMQTVGNPAYMPLEAYRGSVDGLVEECSQSVGDVMLMAIEAFGKAKHILQSRRHQVEKQIDAIEIEALLKVCEDNSTTIDGIRWDELERHDDSRREVVAANHLRWSTMGLFSFDAHYAYPILSSSTDLA